MCKTLGSENISEHAKTMLGWLETGVLQALVDGYLERCILCFSADEAGESCIEAWTICISWTVDQAGVEHPILHMGKDAKTKSSKALALATKAKYTTNYVRKASQAMMRQLISMLHIMDELPNQHWISMQLMYREGITPEDYEPDHMWQRADKAGLHFATKPVQMAVQGDCRTAHNTMTVGVVFADSAGTGPDPRIGIFEAHGVTPAPTGGFTLDCARPDSSANACPVEPLAPDLVESLVEPAREFILTQPEREPVSAATLSERLGSGILAAEAVLARLEECRLLTAFKPDYQARLVRKRRTNALSVASGGSQGSTDDEISGESTPLPSKRVKVCMPHNLSRNHRPGPVRPLPLLRTYIFPMRPAPFLVRLRAP